MGDADESTFLWSTLWYKFKMLGEQVFVSCPRQCVGYPGGREDKSTRGLDRFCTLHLSSYPELMGV